MATATASNSAGTIKGLADGRSDLFRVNPDKLVIITDKTHPLYDERASISLDEMFVKSIMEHGILQPVIVRRNGSLYEVLAGRQRVKGAMEANKRFSEAGSDKVVLVPITLRKDDDQVSAKIMVAENEIRQADSPIVKAKKAQRLLNLGLADRDVANQFGMSVAAFKALLRVLETSDDVQSMVDKGTVPLTAASKLADLPRSEQKAAIEDLKASGLGVSRASVSKKVAAKKEAKRTGAPERDVVLAPRKAMLVKIAAEYADDERQVSQALYRMLTWVINGEGVKKVPGPKPHETLHDCLKGMEA